IGSDPSTRSLQRDLSAHRKLRNGLPGCRTEPVRWYGGDHGIPSGHRGTMRDHLVVLFEWVTRTRRSDATAKPVRRVSSAKCDPRSAGDADRTTVRRRKLSCWGIAD